MIFVTVGAQMPFDRLIGPVDAWAGAHPEARVFAQVGHGGGHPRHCAFVELLDPPAFRERLEACEIVVAHAGMGSILNSLQAGKPILVMPRRGDLGETRNDHQVATAERLAATGRVQVAWDEEELASRLERLDELRAAARIGPHATPQLLAAIRGFVEST
jgi:UDP-N-acetylglucosamine transferase subunit ALG13